MPETITQFHFLRPMYFLLLPVALGVWWLWHRKSDPLQGWRQQIHPQLLRALIVGNAAPARGHALWIPVAWILAIAAMAGPTWKLAPSPFAYDAAPLLILLKADRSMTVADPAPSRLERAQMEIDDLIALRQGQPLGLIAYAGSAHLVLPPTPDTAVVSQMTRELSPDIMPQPGDRLDLALLEAQRVLANSPVAGSVLVIADSIDSDLVSLTAAAEQTALPVQFLAISSPQSSEGVALRQGANAIHAPVQELAIDDSDARAIMRRAAQTPVLQPGQSEGLWQESGYWILPMIAAIFLFTFRQETSSKEFVA